MLRRSFFTGAQLAGPTRQEGRARGDDRRRATSRGAAGELWIWAIYRCPSPHARAAPCDATAVKVAAATGH